ncbi:hypothetical protein ACX0GZ_00020 [Sphingomonas aestuarii]
MRIRFPLMAMAALVAATPAIAQVSDEAIVAAALPDTQFRGFLMRTVAGTDTFKRAFIALGAERGCALFTPAFQATYDKHIPTWRANMVSAWRAHIPAELLEQAVEAGPGEAGRIAAPHAEAVGGAMEASSKPVLTEASAEVLAALAEEAKAVDMASVDQTARIAELEALDARNFCGVMGGAVAPTPTTSRNDEDRPGPEQGR